jgi:TIGR01125: MiaB-like tRNA modifying enzyme YliG, TIGR01125
MKWNNSVWMN